MYSQTPICAPNEGLMAGVVILRIRSCRALFTRQKRGHRERAKRQQIAVSNTKMLTRIKLQHFSAVCEMYAIVHQTSFCRQKLLPGASCLIQTTGYVLSVGPGRRLQRLVGLTKTAAFREAGGVTCDAESSEMIKEET